MAKQFQLSIPAPCHENWEAMTPVEKGRYCSSCKKQVVDFSRMSDREIAQFFKKPAGSTCGRFTVDQLGRDIDVPKKRIPWIKYFFQVAIPAFLLSLKSNSTAAQGKVIVSNVASPAGKAVKSIRPTTLKEEIIPELLESMDVGIVVEIPVIIEETNPFTIFGTVHDTEGNPLVALTVFVKGKNRGVPTDQKGAFSIKVAMGDTLVVSGPGVINKEMVINGKANLDIEVEATRQPEEIVLIAGEVSYCAVAPKKKKEIKVHEKVIPQNVSIISGIYPNPVRNGEHVQMLIRNAAEGYYVRQIIEISGRVLKHEEIWIDREARVLEMELPVLRAGNYFIVLINKSNGRSYSEKLIIQ